MNLKIILFTTASLLSKQVSAMKDESLDCMESCFDQDINPVCADGITFENACQARCEGMGNITFGSCTDNDGGYTPPHEGKENTPGEGDFLAKKPSAMADTEEVFVSLNRSSDLVADTTFDSEVNGTASHISRVLLGNAGQTLASVIALFGKYLPKPENHGKSLRQIIREVVTKLREEEPEYSVVMVKTGHRVWGKYVHQEFDAWRCCGQSRAKFQIYMVHRTWKFSFHLDGDGGFSNWGYSGHWRRNGRSLVHHQRTGPGPKPPPPSDQIAEYEVTACLRAYCSRKHRQNVHVWIHGKNFGSQGMWCNEHNVGPAQKFHHCRTLRLKNSGDPKVGFGLKVTSTSGGGGNDHKDFYFSAKSDSTNWVWFQYVHKTIGRGSNKLLTKTSAPWDWNWDARSYYKLTIRSKPILKSKPPPPPSNEGRRHHRNPPCTQWGWRFSDGYDIWESNLRWVHANHRNDCQPICRNTRGCVGYSWTAHQDCRTCGARCYLKTGDPKKFLFHRHSLVYSATLC